MRKLLTTIILLLTVANCATSQPSRLLKVECFDDFDDPLILSGYAYKATVDAEFQTVTIHWNDHEITTYHDVLSCDFGG